MWTLFLITVLPTSVMFTEMVPFSTEKYCVGEANARNEYWTPNKPIFACLNEQQVAMLKIIPSVTIRQQEPMPKDYYEVSKSIRNAK